MSGGSRKLRSIVRSLEVVETLVELDGATVSELSREMDMAKATVHDHLTTLQEMGYVEVRDGSKYNLSTRFLTIGGEQRNDLDIYLAAKPKLVELADETGEHATLMVEESGYGVLLFTARGERAVQVNTTAGMRTHLHTTALGKAILAHMPEERFDEIVDRHGLPRKTRQTITDRQRLDEELDGIREEGIAFDKEERLTGLRSVAAPVVTREADYHASIGVFGPANRINDAVMEELIPKLQQAANVIEIDVNYSEYRL